MGIKEFTEALGGDEVIDVAAPGPLSIPEALAVRDGFDERIAVQRASRSADSE